MICILEINLSQLFESNKVVAIIADSDVIWHDTPFIEYEQLRLNSNFRQYLETSVIPKKIFRMGTQKTSLQK